MMYVFVLLVAGVGFCVYLFVMYGSIPGAVDERLGRLEALPRDINHWVEDTESDEGKRANEQGQVREVRHRLESAKGLWGRSQIVRQVRYRDSLTREIIQVEAEQRFSRKRIKTPPTD